MSEKIKAVFAKDITKCSQNNLIKKAIYACERNNPAKALGYLDMLMKRRESQRNHIAYLKERVRPS